MLKNMLMRISKMIKSQIKNKMDKCLIELSWHKKANLPTNQIENEINQLNQVFKEYTYESSFKKEV